MTSDGRVGLVPAETKSEDVVCLIMGLDVPFVLRQFDADLYIFIGEAYIHEAMDGEILANCGVEPQDISLQ